MAKKQFKDPFASIRATQERELKRLLEQASKPIAAPPAPSMAGFRQLEAESMNMPIPEYKPPSQAGAIKRSLGALGLGLLEGTEKLREKYSADKLLAERISPELDMIRPKYTPLITPEQSKQYEENIGLQGTLGEGIWRGIGTETPAIALSYGAIGAGTKVPKIAKALTGAGKWTETGRRGVAAGALYTPIAEEKPELKDYLENMALFGAGDVAFMGAIHGIGKGIGKGAEALKGFKRPRDTPEPEATLDFLTGESPAPVRQQPDYVPPPRVAPDFTGTPYGGVYRGGPRAELPGAPERLALPAGKDYLALPAGEKLTYLPRRGEVVNFDLPTPYETLTALERQRPRALTPGEQPPMLPEGYYPNWEFGNRPEADFAVDYGGGTMAKGVDYPPARIPGVDYGGDISLRNKQRVLVDIDKPIPRSDIGDPAYLAGLEKQYGDFVAEEVARMKDELGGVVNVPERNMRVSQNPAWYRNFWQKHLRAPREGEWRDLAIKNLMEGNPETGEPANEEFLAILSELSRGQKLPEEWHGLQKTIRDTSAVEEPELKPLIADMQAEQAKVEPYGLTRDMSRLNEAENAYRGKMNDNADFGQYEGVRFKTADAPSIDYAPVFYSQLQRVIEQKMPNRATPEQIKGILSKGAVKEEELKWADLDSFLEGKQKVTKQEVLDYLRQNDVQVEEVTPSGNRYESYTLPGGENYRELLLTMPGKNQYKSGHWDEPNVLAHVRFNDRTGPNGEKILHVEEVQSDLHQEGRRKGYAKPLSNAEYERIRDAAYKAVDDNDYLGYSNRVEALAFVRRNPVEFTDLAKQEGVNEAGINALREYAQKVDTGGVPDAPFKTTWHELTMKRMIRYAAENGYDRISWTTGAQQAERYDLSKQLKELAYWRDGDEVGISATGINGDDVINQQYFKPSELEGVVGKDIANHILNNEGNATSVVGYPEEEGVRFLTGDNLAIGGSGMAGFYDRMIPSWLNKYAKKWGAKVEGSEIQSGVKAKEAWETTPQGDLVLLSDEGEHLIRKEKDTEGDDIWVYYLNGRKRDYEYSLDTMKQNIDFSLESDGVDVPATLTVHSLPVTKAMRDSVLYEGQPKFKRNLTPEQQQDLEVLKVVAEQRKIGPFTINKVDLAPEAMERPDFQAAGEIADKLGLRLVTFKGKGARGAQHGRTLYINEGITDPVDYVFLHEVTHSMQDFQSQHYGRLFDLSLEHLADAEGIDRHYIEQGYARADRPHEFAADVFAEAMSTPGFFARVAEQAPELVKPLLEAIDRLIANVKGMISPDDTIIPYMRDWEVLRQRIRDEVAMPYFKDAMGEKQFVDTFGHKWQDPAAKAKAENVPEVADNIDTPEFRKWFGDSKVVDESGKPLVVYHGTKGTFNTFKSQYRGTTTGSDSSMLGIFFADAKNVAETYANEALPPKARREYVNYQKNMELFKETGDNIYEENARYHLNEYIRIKTYGKPGKNRIIEGYLNIRNPYIYEANGANGYDIGITEIINKAKKDGHDGVVIKDIYDPAQEIGNGISNHYVVFSPTQIKSVYNRGTWDPANPDIRFKLGEGDKSIVDDFTAMVQYGVKQIPKGNFDHFSKLIQKQFPDELAGYSPEITQRLMKQIWEHSRKLRDAGETVVTLQGKQYPIKRGEVAGEARVRDSEQVPGDIGEVDTRRHIVSKTQREPIIAKETTKMVYTKAVDDLYRIDEMDKFVARTTGKHLPAEDKAYLLAINSREATGAAKAILEENLVDAKGNIIGKSLKEVLDKIPEGKEQDFRDYLVLRNAISWMEQGKKVYPKEWGMTPEKAMQRLAAYDQQIPELKQVADEYVNWHRDMAKSWLVDTGILTPEMWEAFLQAHPHYTPFQRQMKPIETTPGQGKARRGFANQTNPTKKAEGSERPIIDPIESTIEQVDRYIKTAKRNEVMQAVIRNLEKAPEELEGFAEIIPDKKMDMLDDVNAILNRDGIDGVINYLEEPFEQMISRKGKSEQPLDKPNIVRAFANGERVHVKVNDPVLLDSLTALSDTGRNAIVETFRTATRLMKVLTTGGNPIFAARNISRDVPMAYVASETLSKAPVVREAQFAWGMVDALARILTNEKWHPDKFYREYKAMGGGSHTASVAADRNILAESKSRVMPGYWSPKNNNPLTYMGKGAKAGFQGIERFTSTVEALPRLPEYIRTVKKGGNDYASKLEGLHASQDVTVNFSRHGDISKDADAFIPYFNAAVQGIEKIARMWGSDPLGATYRSLVAVTIPTIGLYLWNKDNPNYHKLSSIIRDNYYCIPIQGGEKFIKVAKPREIGVVFSDLPERALRKWEADDPEGFYQFSEAWINNFVPPMRPIVMPIADVMRNRDFAERPIVPGYMEGLSPELQYDEKTSAAAKAIGNAFKLSPKQIDYLFRSYTGVIGELGIPAMAQGQGQNAGQRVGEVLKRTFTADPLYSNDITNKFYEQKERYDTAAKDFKNTGNRGEYFDPARQRYFSRQADRISNIRKEIRKVNADPDLSYEEKEERTRRMQANMLEIAQGAVGDRFSPRIAR